MLIPFQYVDELINTCVLILNFSYIYTFSFCTQHSTRVKARGQLVGVGCRLLPCGCWGWRLDWQAWQQVLLPTSMTYCLPKAHLYHHLYDTC